MSEADFFECVSLLVMAPIATILFFFRIVTTLYVYIDAEERSKSRLFAAALAAAVALCYWPISFLAYIACTVLLDQQPQVNRSVP
jgi:hypothetical protein